MFQNPLNHIRSRDIGDDPQPPAAMRADREINREHPTQARSLDSLMNHIDYIVRRAGVDHVGTGTDFNHGGGMHGFNEACDAPNVTAALLARGYSPAEVDKIWGRNFLRALAAAQAAAG